jgi:hypothetical protein
MFFLATTHISTKRSDLSGGRNYVSNEQVQREPTSTAPEPTGARGAVYEQASGTDAVAEADGKRFQSEGNSGRFSGERAREAGRKGGLARARRLEQAKERATGERKPVVANIPAGNLWEERPDLKALWQEAAGACFDLAVKIADVDHWEDAWGNQLDHDKIGYEENQIYWAMAIAPPLSNPVWPWAPFNLEAWRDGLEAQLREMVLEDGPGKWRERLQRIVDA